MLLTSFGLHFAQSAFCFLCESGIMMSGLVPISLSLPGKVAFDIIEPVSLRVFRCPLKPPPREAGNVCCLAPWLESQGCHLIPLSYLLSCVSAKFSYSFCLVLFLLMCPDVFFLQNILRHFSLEVRLFVYGSCWASRRWQLEDDMRSLLPYGTGICHYTVI